jgi:hypothetical protein
MGWLDLVLAVLFAVLTVFYGIRARDLRRAGDARRARWGMLTTGLLALAALAFAAAFVLTLL